MGGTQHYSLNFIDLIIGLLIQKNIFLWLIDHSNNNLLQPSLIFSLFEATENVQSDCFVSFLAVRNRLYVP